MIEQFANFEPRQLKLIGFGGIALLVAFMLVYLILPEWRAYQGASSSLHLLRTTATEGDKLENQLVLLNDTVSELEHTLNGDASNLPAKQMEAFVIGRLQTISWRNGLTLVSVQPREGTPINQFRELIFDVELAGNYFEFVKWLADVSKELGFVVVKKFEISAAQARADTSGDLKINLSVAAYRNSEL